MSGKYESTGMTRKHSRYGLRATQPDIALMITATSFNGGSRRDRVETTIVKLERYIYSRPDLSITLSDLAQLLHLERTYCCKVFQQVTGRTFTDWLRRIRIDRARTLLRISTNSITDVSHAVGYSDITTFERNFRREIGVSPSSYRRQSSSWPPAPSLQ